MIQTKENMMVTWSPQRGIAAFRLSARQQWTWVDKPFNPNYAQEMQFHQILKRLRSESGIGIKKLGPELGVTYSYISKLENDEAQPSAEFVEKVSTYFDYSSSDLLLSAGHVPPDILEILRTHPQDAVEFLRKHFGAADGERPTEN